MTQKPNILSSRLRVLLSEELEQNPRWRMKLFILLRRIDNQLGRGEAETVLDSLASAGLDYPPRPEQAAVVEGLARSGLLRFQAPDRSFTVHPLREQFRLETEPIDCSRPLKLSRFAILAAEPAGMTLRSPLSDRWIVLHDPTLAGWISRFTEPVASRDLPERSQAVVAALSAAEMLLPCDSAGLTKDDHDPARRMWEVHDLLMHNRSRLGRSHRPVGGIYEFRDQMAEGDGVTELMPAENWHPLPRPIGDFADHGLFDTMARRRSVRRFAAEPVTLSQLGALLHYGIGRYGEGRRAYPNGGRIYEQVFYLAIEGSNELGRGLYRYDSKKHLLGRLAVEGDGVLRLLEDASQAMQESARPPMVLIIASQFAKVRWKYGGLAYALQLKHVGVIQEALYLVATALGLGGCALGAGNSDRFAALTGLDYLREGSIGEFAFGVPEPE